MTQDSLFYIKMARAYLAIVEKTIKHWAVCLTSNSHVKSSQLSKKIILVVWSDVLEERDIIYEEKSNIKSPFAWFMQLI